MPPKPALTVPPEPIIFMKATSAICRPERSDHHPARLAKTDWEVELARHHRHQGQVCLGGRRDGLRCGLLPSPTTSSERAFQTERSGQWTKGKSCDNFGQIGPWLVTRDEVADPQNLSMWLTVNGTKMQNGSTKTMVYGVKYLVSYLSQFMTLHPGDVISTGTPPGVGLGMKPPKYLKAGDVVELGIEGLGQQRQDVIAD